VLGAMGAAVPSLLWWKRWPYLRALLWLVLAVSVGYASAYWHQQRVAAPVITGDVRISVISGVLDEIIDTEKGVKLVITQPTIEYVEPEKTPDKVRLSFKKPQAGLEVGQRVEMRGGLFPLPNPAMADGFDFSRHFYFQGIGAVGFGIAPVTVLEPASHSTLTQFITAMRHKLATHIKRAIKDPKQAAVAAALMTGERAAIPEEVKEAMRIAGLAHMLAISGLHLGLVAGVLFVIARFILVLIPGMAARFSVKKWAAALALLGSACY